MISRSIRNLLTILSLLLPFVAHTQDNTNVARMVVWQTKPGMDRDFEEGYKRHLDWHRRNHDTWSWHGWTIISGERFGYFIDGTFFHTWKELDTPVSPAADSADADINVMPYGEIRSAPIYEIVPGLSDFDPQQLSSPLLTFCYFDIQPGRASEFESLLQNAISNARNKAAHYALLRPATGTTTYLLLLPAEKQSSLGMQVAYTQYLLQSLAQNVKQEPIVSHFHTETARYRAELSNIPGEKSK